MADEQKPPTEADRKAAIAAQKAELEAKAQAELEVQRKQLEAKRKAELEARERQRAAAELEGKRRLELAESKEVPEWEKRIRFLELEEAELVAHLAALRVELEAARRDTPRDELAARRRKTWEAHNLEAHGVHYTSPVEDTARTDHKDAFPLCPWRP